MKREIKKKLKEVQGGLDEYTSQLQTLERRKSNLQPVYENSEATRLQKVMRGHIGRKVANSKRITNLENQLQTTEDRLANLRINLNEQRPEGLRKAKKKLQDRKAEINTQGRVANMTREQRKDETKRLNEQIDHYENTITKRKPGPKPK